MTLTVVVITTNKTQDPYTFNQSCKQIKLCFVKNDLIHYSFEENDRNLRP